MAMSPAFLAAIDRRNKKKFGGKAQVKKAESEGPADVVADKRPGMNDDAPGYKGK